MSIVSLVIGYIVGVVSTLFFTLVLKNTNKNVESKPGEDSSISNSMLGVFALVTIVAGIIYWKVGSPDIQSVNTPETTISSSGMVQQSAEHTMGDLAKMAQRLADKLETTPDNADGWALLARSYVELKQHKSAVTAFEKAVSLIHNDPQLLADYADALAVLNQGRFDEKTRNLIEQALKIDSVHPKALLLSGTIAFKQGDYANAIVIWERLQSLVGKDDTVLMQDLTANITEAKALMNNSNR
jgi:cytochrome c-type biogenesis protein CcmH